jgi:hypothetical protein
MSIPIKERRKPKVAVISAFSKDLWEATIVMPMIIGRIFGGLAR